MFESTNLVIARRDFLSALAAASGAAFVGDHLGFAADPAKDAKKSKEPVPLNKQGTVLLDVDGKRLLLKTKVCLRDGVLEMFCCLKQTKEHESILAIES